jgi:hypothetical protein
MQVQGRMSTAPIVRRHVVSSSSDVQRAISQDVTESAGVIRNRLSRLPEARPAELLWGLPAQCDPAAAKRLVAQFAARSVNGKRRKQLDVLAPTWLEQSEIDTPAAWKAVSLLHGIPGDAALIDDATLQELVQRCEELSSLAAKDAWEDDPVRFQLLAVEGGLLLADWTGDRRRSGQALTCWQELAEAWLDEQGLPAGRYLAAIRPVLASWTRCLQRKPAWLSQIRRSFVGLLRQSLRLTDPQGREAFFCADDSAFLACLESAVNLTGDREAGTLLREVLARSSRTANSPECSPAAYSEKQRVAILRSHLSASSPRAILTFDESVCRLELAGGRPLLMGEWTAELEVDGQRFTPGGGWDEVCWHEDQDVQYLEIETLLGQWRLQRHVLLAKTEAFALLSDTLLGPQPARLSYSSSVPLSPTTTFQPERDTNEGWLVASGRRHLVLPVALPEWRDDRPAGSLSQFQGCLSMSTRTQRGSALFHPLFISLSGSRKQPEYTWRRLTVAEQLASSPSDVAVAHRIQIGDRQWVVYRGLTQGNRTFLGKNLTSEFYAGVLHSTGEMDAIMEVE